MHAPSEKCFLGGGTYVCVCMSVDMTYDATIDTGGERIRVCFTRVWGHEYVITSRLEIAVWENKTRRPPSVGVLSTEPHSQSRAASALKAPLLGRAPFPSWWS